MGTDYSMTEYNNMQFKRIHEKLENYSMEYNLQKGILYDVVDIFDNKEYNLDRLKPIEFSDLKAMLKNFNKNNVFKQLSRDEKRSYITNLKEIKEKQRTAKAERIELLKLKGKQYYSIKIENTGITSSAMIFKSNIINFRNNTANHKNQHIFNSNNGIYSNLRSFENSDDINNLEYGKKQLNELNNHNSIEEKETKGDEFSINTDQNLLSNNYNTYNNNNSNVIFTNYNKRVMIISSRNVKNQKNNSINNISNNSNIILNKKILNDSNALHKSKSSKYENSE